MRNPERIDPFLAQLGEVWNKFPDMRFGQIVAYFAAQLPCDMFVAEDDQWIEAIQSYINKTENGD